MEVSGIGRTCLKFCINDVDDLINCERKGLILARMPEESLKRWAAADTHSELAGVVNENRRVDEIWACGAAACRARRLPSHTWHSATMNPSSVTASFCRFIPEHQNRYGLVVELHIVRQRHAANHGMLRM